ncbi:MAG: TonB-dependent receptor [Prevotellaceae bacterium]|jgi:iron complex outermembrane receptor protein|nr:TonB-dependent receptor [Prevotellaceae bacterium]
MKHLKFSMLRVVPVVVLMLLSVSMAAQKITVSGVVSDAMGPITGATVKEAGATNATMTDIDGAYRLTVERNATLEVSFVGYSTQSVPVNGQTVINVTLSEDEGISLDEVVAIGYGTAKKSDLTGSITAISSRDFQKGLVSNPASLITGKVAGVQIVSNGGRAGDGNTIRIRGGASLNSSNDPLFVIDGVPVDNGSISGMTNPLSTINPNDIESMNILKDASATAIYGSRASNGVVIITTKKGAAAGTGTGTGTGGITVEASTQNSIATIARRVEVLTGDQFREAVTAQASAISGYERYIEMLGSANTDWQKEIFRTAFTTDNNISLSGILNDKTPYRFSFGFISQDGILKTDNMKRGTAALSVNPSFFDDYLKVNINMKGAWTHSRFGNGDAIGEALRMDPTQPVKADGFEDYNGYWQWISSTGARNTMATGNPVALIDGVNDQADVLRSIGNVQLDYKMHFLPDLHANLNVGYDYSNGLGKKVTEPWAHKNLPTGLRTQFNQEKQNLLLEFYLNYTKQLNSANRLEVMAGYTWQDWKKNDKAYNEMQYDNVTVKTEAGIIIPEHNRLISFYGRLNYNLLDRYLLTATVRRDGSSRFAPNNRWGTFPSVALAWRISEEGFLKDNDVLSNLKLRLGWGVTGQQEVGNYEWLPIYEISDPTAQVQFGDQWYAMWRPNGYDSERKWEQTTTKNAGLDFGFANNRIYGSVDYYQKHTTDLLNTVPLPAGSNFSPYITRNIGTMDNWGVEGSIGVAAIATKDIQWDFGFNVTYNNTEITQLSLNDGPDSDYKGQIVGYISGATGNTVQLHKVGYAPNTFYVYQQIYDESGNPIEGAYKDLNGDEVINDQDLYLFHKPAPDWYMGFNTSFTYKRFMVATALRANIGNYVYNNVNSDLGNFSQTLNPNNFLMNNVVDGLNSNFYESQLLSDYYIQNASFLKMDYVQIGYNFGEVFGKNTYLRANATVQNVFTLTKYTGIDPEMNGGIDGNFYPNPRTFSIGLSIGF